MFLALVISCFIYVFAQGSDTIDYTNEKYNFSLEIPKNRFETMLIEEIDVDILNFDNTGISVTDEGYIQAKIDFSFKLNDEFINMLLKVYDDTTHLPILSIYIFDKRYVTNEQPFLDMPYGMTYLGENKEYYFYEQTYYNPVFSPNQSNIEAVFQAHSREDADMLTKTFKTDTHISYYDGSDEVVVS